MYRFGLMTLPIYFISPLFQLDFYQTVDQEITQTMAAQSLETM